MNRDDLPADPVVAIAAVDAAIAEMDASKTELTLLRGRLLREMVAGRGGKARAAAALGVSWTQVQRALGEDVGRRATRALAAAGWKRDEYMVRAAGDHALVALGLDLIGRSVVTSGNAANAMVTALRAAGLEPSFGGIVDGGAEDSVAVGPVAALMRGEDIVVNL